MAKSKVIETMGLGDANESANVQVVNENANYSNREWLENNEPEFPEEFRSGKYDEEREPKVQEGLKTVFELVGKNIHPLVLLLGKWWEVKPARAAIKKMIDEEAAKNNTPADTFLQIVLRENVDKLANITQATDRLKYAITYFKPRAGVSSKEVYKMMMVNGVAYNVSLNLLTDAKIKFGEDKEGLKKYIAENSTKIELAEEL